MTNFYTKLLLFFALTTVINLLSYHHASAQKLPEAAASTFVPLNADIYQLIERYEVKRGVFSKGIATNIKPYERRYVAALADSVAADSSMVSKLSRADRFNLGYLSADNVEFSDNPNNQSKIQQLAPIYATRNDAAKVSIPGLDLHFNPVVYFQGGKERGSNVTNYINTRGVEIRGTISDKIGFYTFFTDNQVVLPNYVRSGVFTSGVLPGEGFWKRYQNTGYDFITARGYITFNATKHVQLQFGHDKNFIGNGYRSLILSDFAPSYTFLKVSTKIWRFNYTNIFAELKTPPGYDTVAGTLASSYINPKYMAYHHLSANITKNFSVGVWESVIFSRPNNNFDINYLNPIIFYRSVEQYNGSPDNVLLGADFKWLVAKRFQFYGQINLDEFVLKQVLKGNGWWGNKQAGQLGVKYIDAFGLSNFDLQAETNIIRPYTYTQESNADNYSHYGQPLAHPMGANLREYILIGRYQPIPRLYLAGKLIYTVYGDDAPNRNYGHNIFLSYNDVKNSPTLAYGNYIGNGIPGKQLYLDATASFMLKHNLFIDLKQVVRQLDLAGVKANTSITSIAIRLNITQRLSEF